MKKFLLLIALLLIGVELTACTLSDKQEYSDYTYLSLEMNPAVDFVIVSEEKALTYRYRNEETEIIEDVILMTPKEIIDLLEIEAKASMLKYRNQTEANAQAIKNELVESLQQKVQAHKSAVENEEKTQPDISGLKQMYLNNYESIHSEYVNRNQSRLQEAKNNQNNKS
ncbi:MAG: hypothetical protein RBR50_04945 [Candidatus Izemoplasmatales bacterium]|nr:hypothetical protein [Candidatus Izemoplasmatales bacterium]